ncbi:hypothetical protein BAJUN_02330 [Bajunvirus bajun]|uniref:Uncharacterized protein n=1 Tax=Brevundimonas phage vB_BgoS-Bajun TaxID=2948594 RepID=A0A9E7N6X6_9CAUD|nr:hypothetical protein BAJUN_02330 [Brevundimonas phage vB_BgoS-Bajun]
MASVIYDSFMQDLATAGLNMDTDTFKVALVTSAYVADKGLHDRFNDITGEVVGTGYTQSGQVSDGTLTLDTALHRLDITFGNVTWAGSTLTARGCVIYKVGATPALSPLVAYVDFGQNVSSTSAAFAVTFSSALRLQN